MQLPKYNFIRATVPLSALHLLAEDPDVVSISEPSLRKTNAGSLMTQGYISHRVRAVAATGIIGSGVKVGVLSDSASSNSIALLKASGDLGTNTTVLQDILNPANGIDEGTAMMEIIHDIAPGAQLYFASAKNGVASFADNINQLSLAGCSILVDNVSYITESVFQDGTIAQAVNNFVAGGGLYISAAGNRGNLATGTSSTWQGDFVNGGAVGAPISGSGETGVVHSFGTQNFNRLTTLSTAIVLQWSEPLGGSVNDYDLFVLNNTGTTVIASSTGRQNGFSNPIEECANPAGFAANSRVVIVLYNGNARALFLQCFSEGTFQFSTSGNTCGHLAAQNSLTVAASYWDSARTGTKPFLGTNNSIESFSSDGPRRIFFNTNGTALTPGNFLFDTGGGLNLLKPDLTGADGVKCRTPGFDPFFGTSAAAAHVAGVAALVKSAKPSLTGPQIRQILMNTAADNMTPGFDINGGYGTVNAQAAVQAALAP
jgi:subtilisin family serine protease